MTEGTEKSWVIQQNRGKQENREKQVLFLFGFSCFSLFFYSAHNHLDGYESFTTP
jgi:hypothetical protein